MSFLKKSELVNVVVNEIIYVAPEDWATIVYYAERLRDEVIGIRNMNVSKCWLGKGMIPYDNSKGPPLKVSVELFDAVDELFEYSEKSGDAWSGLLLKIDDTGKYINKFYYEGTPLLDGDDNELNRRMDEFTE
ncbi:hypothetical protein RFI36_14425 [Acinetobacter gerneri]|uniref:DUF600 family protein n=1 Tax=Acinetobacter gerneri TaxID=202952 RepID=A0AAW8JMI2_9GAMM|nr:hypothetical protein [Acinetobacter gerneri]MDQ9010900.1 hypothetical protein [Acinetobacter gerneri]MDQ9015036.1 hypothetical protein [Acinetobacter gerneri]MDQ9026257.1 hypothetical protein [Acinetobacter gerneri]MDQ9053538.1 hypothetical protein [Acinetobacter gerneri]MDQ9061157.1 hypothetical protein [Acinetobacter gerneri]